jgi:hypothetical protein
MVSTSVQDDRTQTTTTTTTPSPPDPVNPSTNPTHTKTVPNNQDGSVSADSKTTPKPVAVETIVGVCLGAVLACLLVALGFYSHWCPAPCYTNTACATMCNRTPDRPHVAVGGFALQRPGAVVPNAAFGFDAHVHDASPAIYGGNYGQPKASVGAGAGAAIGAGNYGQPGAEYVVADPTQPAVYDAANKMNEYGAAAAAAAEYSEPW